MAWHDIYINENEYQKHCSEELPFGDYDPEEEGDGIAPLRSKRLKVMYLPSYEDACQRLEIKVKAIPSLLNTLTG